MDQNVLMSAPVQFLVHHPYAILFGIVLAEQLGVPLPSVPVLLAAGALAGLGKIGAFPALGLAVLATLAADLAWFEAGRRRGNKVLKFVCRVSLEPDSCVRRTEDVFSRYGPRSLLFVKFVPGLGLMAVTLAGAFGLRRRRFLVFDLPGAVVWAGTYIALGFVFSAQLERAIQAVSQLGFTVIGLVLTLVALWLIWKYAQRRRFIRNLQMDRISPEDLRRKLDAGEPIAIVDLRHRLDFEADPRTLPGALRFDTADLEQRHAEIPRDRDVVLYCT
jgi:membrane protein DedA with SNARE-associated domain